MPQLQHLEMPLPGSEKDHLLKIKSESGKKYPIKNKMRGRGGIMEAPAPIILRGFEANKFSNSVPNDNHLAISNGGKLISVSNTTIRAYDVTEDTLIFNKSLSSFALSLGFIGPNNSKFDPKVIYDPENDRFILVFLNGATPGYSKIIVAFSTTGNPADPWNLYYLNGNPLNDGTWSDYPAIAITQEELFITINQIIPGQPWQTGFSQTLIWQLKKSNGFTGDSLLTARLWKDIWFGLNPVRNLCPVIGGSRVYGPNIFLLSNRNFAIQNDTIFVAEITGTMDNANAALKISYGISDVPYGVPPTARQFGGHTFETNDGRVLGSFFENNKIQFVSNSIDTSAGLAAVYHGIITNPGSSGEIKGAIISDTTYDFGYPNIAYTGRQDCDDEALITFNHTSPAVYSGFSGIYYSNNDNYSPIIKIKEGDNYVDFLAGIYERWGDYSGSQRKYNDPGKIWVAGSYGNAQKLNATWVAELQSPDSNSMSIRISETRDVSKFLFNDGYAIAEAQGGNPPYSYQWSNGTSSEYAIDLSAGRYYVTITDAYTCSYSDSVEIFQPDPVAGLFPNPAVDGMVLNFTLETDEIITISITDMQGRLVRILWEDQAKAGKNIFTFSAQPLAKGVYFLEVVSQQGIQVLKEKFVKL